MTDVFRVKRVYEKYFLTQTRDVLTELAIPYNPATPYVCLRRVKLGQKGHRFIGVLIGKDTTTPLDINSSVIVSYKYCVREHGEKPEMIMLITSIKTGATKPEDDDDEED